MSATRPAVLVGACILLALAPGVVVGFMDCDVRMCGVLTLSTGFGEGPYEHAHPVVHGLWPETGNYGESSCVRPKDPSDLPYEPDKPELLQCYNTDGDDKMSERENWFVNHEWNKHGKCAGMSDVTEFLKTVCDLARKPLDVMDHARKNRKETTNLVAEALKNADYPVYDVSHGYTQEVQLSACAGDDRVWKIVPVKDFAHACPSKSRPPSPPKPAPSPSADKCVPMKKGPPCPGGDKDCKHFNGCIRCAGSGYCTDVPLPDAGKCVPGKHGPSCADDSDCGDVEGCVRCAHSGYCTDLPLRKIRAGGWPSAAVTYT